MFKKVGPSAYFNFLGRYKLMRENLALEAKVLLMVIVSCHV